jgi:aspartate kinase
MVTGRGMVGIPGIAARTFMAVARQNANVLMISQSSSEQSICFVVPQDKSEEVVQAIDTELEHEFGRQDINRTSCDNNIQIVTVVGAGMRAQPGVAARVFGALGEANVNILAIAQGASDYCLSVVVHTDESETAVRQIHKLVLANGNGNGHHPEILALENKQTN